MIELSIKIDRIADFGLVGEVFNNYIDEIRMAFPDLKIERNEAALIIGMIFAEVRPKFRRQEVEKSLELVRNPKNSFIELLKRLDIEIPAWLTARAKKKEPHPS